MMVETYGQRVARLRDELRITQDEFATRVGIPKRTLQDIESGKVARPQRKTREKIEAALGAGDPEQTREDWPIDVKVFLDVMGVFLSGLPAPARERFIHDETRRIMSLMR